MPCTSERMCSTGRSEFLLAKKTAALLPESDLDTAIPESSTETM
eukprot:COSAG01_NODE_52819_length_343_cov_210.303279_2_plen_43_part_01